MQKRGKRLKYAIATAATVAVLVATPFLFKKCMKEDIQKRVEPPKKALVTENNKKAAAKELANLITAVTPIEEEDKDIEEKKEPKIIDEDVKKIIDEFPYEKLNCEKLSLEEIEKRREDEEIDWNALNSDDPEVNDPVGAAMERLGKNGKINELLSVLEYYESLGSTYKIQDDDFEFTSTEYIDYMTLTGKAIENGETMYYDPKCVNLHFNLYMRASSVLFELSKILIKREDNVNSLKEMIPETYQPKVETVFIIELLDTQSISQEYFEEQMNYFIYKNGVEDLIDSIGIFISGEDESVVKKVRELMKNTKNKELRRGLKKVLNEWKKEKEEWEILEKEIENEE